MKTGLANIFNFSQLPLSNSLFTVLFAYVVFFACFVVRDFCTPPPPPDFLFFFLPTILSLTQT